MPRNILIIFICFDFSYLSSSLYQLMLILIVAFCSINDNRLINGLIGITICQLIKMDYVGVDQTIKNPKLINKDFASCSLNW